MIGIIYIGSDKKTQERLKFIPGHLVKAYSNGDDVVNVCNAAAKNENFLIFYEQSNIKNDASILKILKKKCRSPYIILLTSSALSIDDKNQYLKCGINDTLDKNASITDYNKKISFIAERELALFDNQTIKHGILKFKIPLWKRMFDIVFSLLGIIVLSPIMIITAIAIKIESKGPIIFKSKRVGTNYIVFDFLKFRSMYIDAEQRLRELQKTQNQYSTPLEAEEQESKETSKTTINDGMDMMISDDEVMLVGDDFMIAENNFSKNKSQEINNAFVKIENDPRVTKVGKFIRKFSIDELPQLFNILKGDMSIVGNRPIPLYEAEKLTRDDSIDRFIAPAGLTGLWQVSKRGDNGKMSAEERKALDIRYGQTYSFMLDMKIILKTFTAFVQKGDS